MKITDANGKVVAEFENDHVAVFEIEKGDIWTMMALNGQGVIVSAPKQTHLVAIPLERLTTMLMEIRR